MKIFNKTAGEYCRHCLPFKRKYHYVFHLEYYFSKFIGPFRFLFFKKKNSRNGKYGNLWGLIFEILSFLKIAEFVAEPEKTKLFNRDLIFFEEARKRNLEISAVKFLGKYINEFRFIYQKKRYYYEGAPLTLKSAKVEMDNKGVFKNLLQNHHLPAAEGKVFVSRTEAIKWGEKIGYPLVVKPNSGSLSSHLTCPVGSEIELQQAIKIAKIYRPDFIVEKYVKGNLYRASVIAEKYVFVCQKERANVVGDGQSTIQELIRIKNSDPRRGETDQKNTTLHKIPLNDELEENIQSQGLAPESILPRNKKIYLQNKAILSQGCDIIDCPNIHPDNQSLFLKIARLLETDLVGLDFICPDIGQSYQKQETAILEANSLPYIDMHQYPSQGQSRPIAKLVWDIVLKDLSNGRREL